MRVRPAWKSIALSLRLGLVSVALMLLALPKPALAHGIDGCGDLPVPLGYFVAGAVTVLIVTFMALVLLWPRPRLQQPFDPRPIRFPGWRWIVKAMRWLGTLGLLLVVLTGLFGVDNSVRNPAPVMVWVVFWLVVPFVGVALGNLYRLLNPWDSLAVGPPGVWGGNPAVRVGGHLARARVVLWFLLAGADLSELGRPAHHCHRHPGFRVAADGGCRQIRTKSWSSCP